MTSYRKVLVVEIGLTCIGCALVAAAAAADQPWLDRHFLPAFFIPPAQYVGAEQMARLAVALIGVVLAVLLRRRAARFIAKDPVLILTTLLAFVLAFGSAELFLRRGRLRAAEEVAPRKEPLRFLDARLGWLFVPSHVGYQSNNGRRVQYA